MTTTITDLLQTLARNLELHMRLQGWTEDTLAKASGVSRRTVGNFLRPGNRKPGRLGSVPSGTLANLFKIEAALGLSASQSLLRNMDARARFHEAVHDAIEAAYVARRDPELNRDDERTGEGKRIERP